MKRSTINIVGILLFPVALTSCSNIGKSQAYKDGVKAGKSVQAASDLVKGVSDLAESLGAEKFSVGDKEKGQGCEALWVVRGLPKYTGKNLAKEKEEFIKGCNSVLQAH